MDGDLHAERLPVAIRVSRACRVRRDQQRSGTCPTDQAERALAEGGNIDEEVAASVVVGDVLALVLERLVELEDPRAELMDIHGARLS